MKRKKTIYIVGVFILILLLSVILYRTRILSGISVFLENYIKFVNTDIELQAKLFENIIGGICSGAVTFGALLITILYENKKDRTFWERERKKEKEDRLLAIRPFLNIEVKSVSSIRTGRNDKDRDYVMVGNGIQFQYAHIVLSNNGYGKCKGIELEGHKCSVYQLDIEEKSELDIYFKGIENEETIFPLVFCYKDIFGNSYLQQFTCSLKCGLRELKIEIGEPLLKRGEE